MNEDLNVEMDIETDVDPGERREPLAIGLVTAHFPPGRAGGVETVVRAQARELVRLGQDVRVVAGSDWLHAGRDVLRGDVDGARVAYLPRTAEEIDGPGLSRPRLRELVLAEARGLDVVHVHEWSTLTDTLVRDLAQVTPVVVTMHDFFSTCPRSFRIPTNDAVCPESADAGLGTCSRCLSEGEDAQLELSLRERRSGFEAELAAASQIVLPSASHLARLHELVRLPLDRTVVVHHGLCAELTDASRGRGHWDGRRPLAVLHFGHRSELKGTLDLVEALASLPPGRVELVLAGNEADPGLDARVRAAAGALEVRFLGPYDARQLQSVAGICDLAAFPSRAEESYGLVIEEALAMGLPVWVSDRGAPVEIIDACATGRRSPGRVLPAGDSAAWTSAFLDLLDEPSRLKRYRQAIPPTVRTAADAASELLDHYRALTAGASADERPNRSAAAAPADSSL